MIETWKNLSKGHKRLIIVLFIGVALLPITGFTYVKRDNELYLWWAIQAIISISGFWVYSGFKSKE
jgi:hypothetical protein